jgi:hypothetical protein
MGSLRVLYVGFEFLQARNNLYRFRDSIQPFSLGHGRRVLLSAMYLLLQGRALDMMHIKRFCLAV